MANKLILRTGAKADNASEYRFSLEIYIFKEDSNYIAYCPALDISSCAETYNDAISSFYEMLQLHVECCIEAGTLHDDLLAHGWKFRKKSILPPAFTVLMKKPEMKKLLGSNMSFERVVAPARIPALA